MAECASDAAALQGRGRRSRQQDGPDHLGDVDQGRNISRYGNGKWRRERLTGSEPKQTVGAVAGRGEVQETDDDSVGRNPEARKAASVNVLKARAVD